MPVLVGAVELPDLASSAARYFHELQGRLPLGIHDQIQRQFISAVSDGLVRLLAIPALIGLARIIRPRSRWFQICVYVTTIAAAVAYLALPIAAGGVAMVAAWRNPFYCLPALAICLSALSLWLIRARAVPRRQVTLEEDFMLCTWYAPLSLLLSFVIGVLSFALLFEANRALARIHGHWFMERSLIVAPVVLMLSPGIYQVVKRRRFLVGTILVLVGLSLVPAILMLGSAICWVLP